MEQKFYQETLFPKLISSENEVDKKDSGRAEEQQ